MKEWFKRFRRGGPPSSESGEDLLTVAEFQLLLAGDKRVLGKFIPAVLPTLRGAVRGVLARRGPVDPSLEDDLTQDIFERLLSDMKGALGRWDPDKRKSLQSFVWQWASWRVVDQLRGTKYHRSCEQLMKDAELELAAGSTTSDDSSSSSPEQLWPALLQLFNERADPEDKALFHQYYVLERKPKELAAELGINDMNVYQRLFRLRKRLLVLRDELLRDR